VNLGHLWNDDALLAPQIEALLSYAREGKLTPRVDRSFPLAEAAAAHRYIHERRNIGKVVLAL
jgi:NADPH:quinone reductase-like Zn-dependent oxidoreductase